MARDMKGDAEPLDYVRRARRRAKPFPSFTIGDVLDCRHWLRFSRLGGGGVLSRLEPMTNADCDRSSRLDGMGGENRASSACGYAWERGEGAHGDEHSREGGHYFGVLGCEEVEGVTGVEEPDWSLCGDWRL